MLAFILLRIRTKKSDTHHAMRFAQNLFEPHSTCPQEKSPKCVTQYDSQNSTNVTEKLYNNAIFGVEFKNRVRFLFQEIFGFQKGKLKLCVRYLCQTLYMFIFHDYTIA